MSFFPIPIFGMILTILFFCLDRCCCSCTPTPDLQQCVLNTDDPLVEYVKTRDDRGERIVISMEDLDQK